MTSKKNSTELAESSTSDATASEAIPFEQLQIKDFQLQDIPRKLPVGFFVNGERLQHFELKPYTTEHDLLLGRRSNEDTHLTLKRFLPTIVQSIGGYSVPDLAKELSTTQELLFERANFGDALAIVLNIRLETVGTDVALTDQCPRCNTKNEDNTEKGFHDLGQVDISVAMGLNQPLVVAVTLQDGFSVFDQQVKTVLFKPFRLFQMAHKDLRTAGEDRAEVLMMYQMICGMPEVPEYEGVHTNLFDDGTYRQLTLRDRDILLKAARSLIKLGPRLIMETTCEACRWEWKTLLPWRFLRGFLSEPADSAE